MLAFFRGTLQTPINFPSSRKGEAALTWHCALIAGGAMTKRRAPKGSRPEVPARASKMAKTGGDDFELVPETHIDDLNRDCLFHIFKWLDHEHIDLLRNTREKWKKLLNARFWNEKCVHDGITVPNGSWIDLLVEKGELFNFYIKLHETDALGRTYNPTSQTQRADEFPMIFSNRREEKLAGIEPYCPVWKYGRVNFELTTYSFVADNGLNRWIFDYARPNIVITTKLRNITAEMTTVKINASVFHARPFDMPMRLEDCVAEAEVAPGGEWNIITVEFKDYSFPVTFARLSFHNNVGIHVMQPQMRIVFPDEARWIPDGYELKPAITFKLQAVEDDV